MMRLMLISVFCLSLFASCFSQATAGDKEITIHFKQVNADSLGIVEPILRPERPVKADRLLEKILAYPADYTLISLYQLHMQNYLKYSKLFMEDSTFKAVILQSALPVTTDFLQRIYPPPPIDDIVSACLVKDKQGTEYFVFDANNDEDFNNDPIIHFKDFENRFFKEIKRSYSVAEHNVTIEIFDGQAIQQRNLLLGFFKMHDPNGSSFAFFSNRRPNSGTLKIGDETFRCILFSNPPDVNYRNTDFLWIDLNHDNQYNSREDFLEQLYQPFTLGHTSYRVKTLDVFGQSLTLEALDAQEAPPIAAGLPCPDFEVTFTDSTRFSASQARGHYLVLDFWLCNDQYCDMMSKNLINKIERNQSIFWISCPLGPQSYQRLKKNGGISGDDFRHFVAPQDIDPLRELFQVRTNKILIVVNPQGKIESIEKFKQTQSEQILKQVSAGN